MSPVVRVGLKLVAGAAVALALGAAAIDAVAPGPGGPAGSSYATAPGGVSAYGSLLARSGHRVSRLRVMPANARLDPATTLVVLDPAVLGAADVGALRRFVAAGGSLVAGGQDPAGWLAKLLPDPPAWSTTGTLVDVPLLAVPETSGISEVRSAGAGSWSDPQASLPVLGAPGSSLLTVTTLGAGTIDLLADSSPLQNRLLAEADDAALGLALAGGAGRPVVFEEAIHGYGGGNGLAALPMRWKWALIGLALAALTGVAARIRRLAPPDPQATPVLPPRREHVDALAAALARTGPSGEAAAEAAARLGLATLPEPSA